MRVRLIVNPAATGVRGPVLDAVQVQLERVCRLEVTPTERAGHAVELAAEVGEGAVVGVGGDGIALHERMTITTAGGGWHRASYVAVANQHPYTYFGRIPVRATPRADFEHGLDVVFTRELRRRHLWRLPVYALVWPRHARSGS